MQEFYLFRTPWGFDRMRLLRTSATLVILTFAQSLPAADFMFQADFAGKLLEGQPLFWTDSQMLLLARDGTMHQVDPRDAKQARRTAPTFQGHTPSQMRTILYEEFGDALTVTSTGHYLVVHRHGESDAWAQRFEQLYRSFQQYFRVRGFSLHRPKFPLVAIIFPTEAEYVAHAEALGGKLQPNTLGHYDPKSNRVLMYDRVAVNDRDWGITANTIVHEATHQTAYNVGIHNRAADNPIWVVEGLATMFEARGVYQSEPSDTIRQRINRGRLDDFHHFHEGGKYQNVIADLVASDNAFKRMPARAYADSWALTFYLTETRPREYEQYLQRIAARKPLASYWAEDRVRDFQAVFGDDLTLLESNFFVWMNELR